MVKHTLAEIMNASSLPLSPYAEMTLAERLYEYMFNISYYENKRDVSLGDFKVLLKGSRCYDGERGAEIYVVTHKDIPICVASFAGRGLDDASNVVFFNNKMVIAFCNLFIVDKNSFEDEPLDYSMEIPVVYWEGCPIVLGKDIYGYDKE